MNSAPNRDRALRMGRDCPCCSTWLLRTNGTKIKDYSHDGRYVNRNRHGQVKPKGQHAYRKGLAR